MSEVQVIGIHRALLRTSDLCELVTDTQEATAA